MNKKRLIALICVSVFLFYLISVILTFLMLYVVRSNYYPVFTTHSSLQSAADDGLSSLIETLSMEYPRAIGAAYDDVPYTVALYDPDGNRLFIRGNTLFVWGDPQQETVFYCNNIEEYITPEQKELMDGFIGDLTENRGVGFTSVSFGTENDKTVPTQLVMYDLFSPEKTLCVPIGNATTSLTLKNYDECFISFDCYDLGTAKQTVRRFERLREISEEFITGVFSRGKTDAYRDLAEFGTSVLSLRFSEVNENGSFLYRFLISDHLSYDVRVVEINGESYCVFYAALYNEAQDVLCGSDFHMIAGGLTALFMLICAGLLAASLALFKKNERLNAARAALTSAAAHELKTPLAVIQNQSEFVMENIAPEKNCCYISSIHDEAERMNGIVSSFLRYNRLANMKKTEKNDLDLCEVVRGEAEKYRVFSENNGVSVSLSLPQELYVRGNRDMLALAVDNYISNAVKYSSGEKRVKIELTARRGRFRLAVYNDGEKLSVEQRKNIWELLSRSDRGRSTPDNSPGMGLSICAQIFRLHGFKYGCDSTGAGMVFFFGTMGI